MKTSKEKIDELLIKILNDNNLKGFKIELSTYIFSIKLFRGKVKITNDLYKIPAYELNQHLKIYIDNQKSYSISFNVETQLSTCGIVTLHSWYISNSINFNNYNDLIEIVKLIAKQANYGALMINHINNSIISNQLLINKSFKKVFTVVNPRTDNIIYTFMTKL